MEIIVITFYNSTNYGAFLQAKALEKILSRYGQVYFLKTKLRSLWKSLILSTVKFLFKFQIRKCIFTWRKYFSFAKNIGDISTTSMNGKHLEDVELIVYGSDEIWNVKRKACKSHLLWGDGFEGMSKISYAPSMNNSTEKDLYENSSPEKYLQRFSRLSARDKHTRDIIANLTKRDVALVLDPTFLLDPECYMSLNLKKNFCDYIAVYGHSSQIDEMSERILQNIASQSGHKLISLLSCLNWCDYNVCVANPFAYYIDADFVITSTFHGTVFAIIFKKQFIVYSENNLKVNDLLEQFNLSDRIANGLPIEQVKNLIEEKIDYEKVDKILNQKRKESLNFLYSAIMEQKEGHDE